MNNTSVDFILDEQRFPFIGMSLEERNYYLNIISNCKDICDSENKVGNESKCDIVELHLKKENNVVSVNGSLVLGRECRFIEADIFINDNSILVDMLITRLGNQTEHKKYRVTDEFKIENDILKRKSYYNYNMQSIFCNIDDEEMKGRLK